MTITIYRRTGRTGGTSDDLDGIDGAGLSEGDIATVYLTSGSIEYKYEYRLNATSGAAESDPDIIAPDTNPGSKRWILQSVFDSRGVMFGDSTFGRVLRVSTLAISDGTDADTLKVRLYGSSSGCAWNGDAAAEEDNLGKGDTGTNFTLTSNGQTVFILASAFSGNAIALLSYNIYYDQSGFTIKSIYPAVTAGKIAVAVSDGSSLIDLTTISTTLQITLTYLTSE